MQKDKKPGSFFFKPEKQGSRIFSVCIRGRGFRVGENLEKRLDGSFLSATEAI